MITMMTMIRSLVSLSLAVKRHFKNVIVKETIFVYNTDIVLTTETITDYFFASTTTQPHQQQGAWH